MSQVYSTKFDTHHIKFVSYCYTYTHSPSAYLITFVLNFSDRFSNSNRQPKLSNCCVQSFNNNVV